MKQILYKTKKQINKMFNKIFFLNKKYTRCNRKFTYWYCTYKNVHVYKAEVYAKKKKLYRDRVRIRSFSFPQFPTIKKSSVNFDNRLSFYIYPIYVCVVTYYLTRLLSVIHLLLFPLNYNNNNNKVNITFIQS